MSVYKIFISSPGDVGRERHLAEQVIRRVAAEFQNRVEVQPYFWEYEPMESTLEYQENIPLTSTFDLVMCILWKRLGSLLSVKHQRPDGGRWRSGTEFELVTAVESKKARGAPDIFILKNDTKTTIEADDETDGAKAELDLAQWKALKAFIKEWCEGVQDGQREPVSPEFLHLQVKLAAQLPYRQAAALLEELLPETRGLNYATTRNRTLAVGKRIEEEIREEIDHARVVPERVERMIVGIDGAFIKAGHTQAGKGISLMILTGRVEASQRGCRFQLKRRLATDDFSSESTI